MVHETFELYHTLYDIHVILQSLISYNIAFQLCNGLTFHIVVTQSKAVLNVSWEWQTKYVLKD